MNDTLKNLRKQLDKIPEDLINQKAIADGTGFSKSYVSMLLNGERNNENALRRIVVFLRIKLKAFVQAA